MVTNNKITSNSLQEMLETVQADREAKKVFLAMPREEQLLAILGMLAFTNSQLALLQKEFIEHKADAVKYRADREEREKHLTEILETDPEIKAMNPDDRQNTVQKIIALAMRPARSGALLDKVLSLILVILFVLFITGKLP